MGYFNFFFEAVMEVDKISAVSEDGKDIAKEPIKKSDTISISKSTTEETKVANGPTADKKEEANEDKKEEVKEAKKEEVKEAKEAKKEEEKEAKEEKKEELKEGKKEEVKDKVEDVKMEDVK